jgi:lactam utilization protein B
MKSSEATVLVAGDIQSAAVTTEQIRAIFQASGITIRTVAQIEQTDPKF